MRIQTNHMGLIILAPEVNLYKVDIELRVIAQKYGTLSRMCAPSKYSAVLQH